MLQGYPKPRDQIHQNSPKANARHIRLGWERLDSCNSWPQSPSSNHVPGLRVCPRLCRALGPCPSGAPAPHNPSHEGSSCAISPETSGKAQVKKESSYLDWYSHIFHLPLSRVVKRCQGPQDLSYEAARRVDVVHCAGFFLLVNEKPETSGFSLVFPPGGRFPRGGIFC